MFVRSPGRNEFDYPASRVLPEPTRESERMDMRNRLFVLVALLAATLGASAPASLHGIDLGALATNSIVAANTPDGPRCSVFNRAHWTNHCGGDRQRA